MTAHQGREPDKRIGDIFLELGFLSASQMQKIEQVQRDLVIKHRAKQAMSGRTASFCHITVGHDDNFAFSRKCAWV